MVNLLPWIAVLIGFIGLVWSADRFVDVSATIANDLGVPKLLIGLTIVAFGTSAPEIVVSISSSLRGVGEIAIGNALGSNLANVGLVLGCTLLMAPLTIKPYILKQETPIMLAVTGITGWFLYDNQLNRIEGIVLVLLIFPVMGWLALSREELPREEENMHSVGIGITCLWFMGGLTLLIGSAELLVWGAIRIAFFLGISPLFIGLTIVAVGTSLPELAASVMSVLRGHHDIAIGNIIGSNIFNLLLVAGIPAIIQPIELVKEVFNRDYLSMLCLSLVLSAIMLGSTLRNGGVLERCAGLLMLTLYAGYYVVLL